MSNAAAPAATETRCLRCGRKLTASTGYGPTCLRKIRAAALDAARADFTADQQAKADELIRDGGLVPTTLVIDRDVNAARNLLNLAASGAESRNACGGTVRPRPARRVPAKQEPGTPSGGKTGTAAPQGTAAA